MGCYRQLHMNPINGRAYVKTRVCHGASLVLVRVMRVDRSFVWRNSRSTRITRTNTNKTEQ
jgi:hypothetical protein